jgi:hypothetical protein
LADIKIAERPANIVLCRAIIVLNFLTKLSGISTIFPSPRFPANITTTFGCIGTQSSVSGSVRIFPNRATGGTSNKETRSFPTDTKEKALRA